MRQIFIMSFAALTVVAVCGSALADEKYAAKYLSVPVYDRAMRLADGIAVSELVVVGTALRGEKPSGRMQVHEILFGKVNQDGRGDDGSLVLAKITRVAWRKRGVWLLVRTQGGYLSVNPDVEPLSLDEYRRLKRPKRHWTDARDLVAQGSGTHQLFYTYPDPNSGNAVWHGPNTYAIGREVVVDFRQHGERVFWIRWESNGQIDRVSRYPVKGHGFFLKLEGDRVVWFGHYKDRQHHGLERRYYTNRRDPPRFEKHYTDGVVDGVAREWDKDGKLVSHVNYESGLIPPIVRYTGKGSAGIKMYRTQDGVNYVGSPAVTNIKLGMTTEQVSEVLKVDFSPASGIHFPTFHLDLYLHIAFKDGKVSAVKTGHNGICLDVVPDIQQNLGE